MIERDSWVPSTADDYAKFLSEQREARRSVIQKNRETRLARNSLSPTQRHEILKKTNSRCHICGGEIGEKWQADHVLSYSKGGEHSVGNYLPAHNTCNNYRWHYSPEEFHEILKLGVWAKTQVINGTSIGVEIAEKFVKYEVNRIKRRK